MKRILIAIVLIFSLLLIPSTTNIASADESDNTSYEFGNVTLEVEVVPPVPAPTPSVGNGDGGDGGEGIIYSITTNLFGIKGKYLAEYGKGTSRAIEATSKDGNLTVSISAGTAILDEKGKRVKNLQMAVNGNPPSPPRDANVIGFAYEFEPIGTTFEPSITLTWHYDPGALPKGVTEEDLTLAYYMDGEWIELACLVTTKTNTITASVSHFTTFAIIGTVTPLVVPTIPETPAVIEPTPPVVVAPEPTVPIPTPTPIPVPITPAPTVELEPEVPPELIAEPDGFPVWAIVLLGLPIAAILAYWIFRRRRAS